MKLISLILIFGVSIFISCNSKSKKLQNNTVSLKVISNFEEEKALPFSDIGNSIQIVKLDSEITIGKIDRVITAHDHYYILDLDYASGLFKFDKQGSLKGKLLFDLDQKFDFNSITDFYYDGNLILHDGNKGINFVLDKDLNIIEQKRLPFKANSLRNFENKLLIFNNYLQRDWNYDLLVINKNELTVEASYIPVNPDDYGFHYDSRFTFNMNNEGNQVYFSKAFNDTIYSIDKDFQLSRIFTIDFKDKKVDKNYLRSGINAMDLLTSIRNGDFYFTKGELHFTAANELLMKILKDGKYMNMLIKEKELNGVIFPVFVDNFKSNYSFYDIVYSDQEKLIFGASSENLFNNEQVNPSFLNTYNIHPDDNFILFIVNKEAS